MSDITSINGGKNGSLLYTCNCGFIDAGHANPEGPTRLWSAILQERHAVSTYSKSIHTLEGQPAFVINAAQGMGPKYTKIMHARQYLIRKGLSRQRKEQVALSIFMEVSMGFEQLQATFPWTLGTNSGFSAEDLMSNLVSFYRAVRGISWPQILDICGGVVSDETARYLYRKHFPKGIEAVKERQFFKPRVFHSAECTKQPQQMPALFKSIKPAERDSGDFIRLPPPSPSMPVGPNEVVDFDRWGNKK